MRCRRDGGLGGTEIVVNGETRDKVVNFRYLGVDIAATVSLKAEVELSGGILLLLRLLPRVLVSSET